MRGSSDRHPANALTARHSVTAVPVFAALLPVLRAPRLLGSATAAAARAAATGGAAAAARAALASRVAAGADDGAHRPQAGGAPAAVRVDRAGTALRHALRLVGAAQHAAAVGHAWMAVA